MDQIMVKANVVGLALDALMSNKKLSDILREFTICGAEENQPEGTRYVQISETLWGHIVDAVARIEARASSKEA